MSEINEVQKKDFLKYIQMKEVKCPCCGSTDYKIGSFHNECSVSCVPYSGLDEKNRWYTATDGIPVYRVVCHNCCHMFLFHAERYLSKVNAND